MEFAKIGPDVFGWKGLEIKPTYQIGSGVLRKNYCKQSAWEDNDLMNVQPLQKDLQIDGGTYINFESFSTRTSLAPLKTESSLRIKHRNQLLPTRNGACSCGSWTQQLSRRIKNT